MTFEEIKEILIIFAKYDWCEGLYWDMDLNFYVSCNDLFAWGCADAEDVTIKDLPLLKQSFEDDKYYGIELYCARKRKMRPQGAFYKSFEKESWPLFDACGPEREVGFGNPLKPGE